MKKRRVKYYLQTNDGVKALAYAMTGHRVFTTAARHFLIDVTRRKA